MATVFSTKDPNPGMWFKFDDNDPESGEINIRVVNHVKRKEIRKACVKKRVEYKHGQRFEFEEVDDDIFSEMIWEYSIADWNKLEDDAGKPLICDKETKVFLMQNNVGFAQFVGKCMEKISEIEASRVAVIEKNLSSGSTGSEASQPVKPAEN